MLSLGKLSAVGGQAVRAFANRAGRTLVGAAGLQIAGRVLQNRPFFLRTLELDLPRPLACDNYVSCGEEAPLGGPMSGKMNWDRVRKENLAYQHGSEWVREEVDPESVKSPVKRVVSSGPVMPGCTCGKRVGFTGQHKSRCNSSRDTARTRSGTNELIVHKYPAVIMPTFAAAAPLTPRRFASAMNGIARKQAMRNLLAGFWEVLANDMTSSVQQKRDAL